MRGEEERGGGGKEGKRDKLQEYPLAEGANQCIVSPSQQEKKSCSQQEGQLCGA